ncbi:hypothetical protein NEUTE2DRAFT_156073 [Neurospora tetrasperma FGSC 2509]|nr:hypothetical protein NEUTE2DRAFT_156073 [Neurospora tetrasperma FGSC 2509]
MSEDLPRCAACLGCFWLPSSHAWFHSANRGFLADHLTRFLCETVAQHTSGYSIQIRITANVS